LDKTPLKAEDIDWFIPHQANKRIIYAAAKAIGIDESKIIYTGNKHANTSAASVPLAFHEAYKSGRIKSGNIILFESFGAGFTWGATLVKV
jgi:3-oxoacyl-[acyl-carrier-protein] synthase-3